MCGLFTTVKVVFYKTVRNSNIRCFKRECPYKQSKQYVLDQTDRIGSVGYVSTLIESIQSTEWQGLKNKTDMYKAITILKYVRLLTLTCRKDLGQFPIQSAQILTACG